MIIYGVYIITEGGDLLYSEGFHTQNKPKDNLLISGLLTALKMFASEVTDSDVRAFEVEGLTYHFHSFGIFYVVLVCSSPQEPQQYLHELGLRFMKKFGERYIAENKTDDYKFFESFRVDVKEILGELIDVSHSINPIKKLTTAEIFSLPREIQKVALIMLDLEQATLEKISSEAKLNEKNTLTLINRLIELGYIGQKTTSGSLVYFCTF